MQKHCNQGVSQRAYEGVGGGGGDSIPRVTPNIQTSLMKFCYEMDFSVLKPSEKFRQIMCYIVDKTCLIPSLADPLN